MDDARRHFTYAAIMLATMAGVMLPVLALNGMLGARSLGNGAAVRHASAWQQATHGITYAPPLSNTRPFKSARLRERLPAIDTVVFGSSTAMGITQGLFREGASVYNFAQTGNGLAAALAEARYIERTQPQVRKLVIPLDWALGFLYEPAGDIAGELAPASPDDEAPAQVSLAQQFQDALSLPRVKNLFSLLKDVVRAPSPAAAFRAAFLQEAGDDYRCADGSPARDYDTIFRGTCTGFRFDGSATFANLEPVTRQRAASLIAGAVVASSKYALALTRSRGAPGGNVLLQLEALARAMRARGGDVLLFMPPLLPGLERALLAAPHTATPLARTRQLLDDWARARRLTILDAGQSEQFGCTSGEFVDEHHALPACYARVFAHYWQDLRATGGLRAGLYHPD